MAEKKVTYLIVGAGLAGCTCAYLLARAGYDVLLIERQDLQKKSKLCAGLLTPRTLRLLDELYGGRPESIIRSRFDSMRCVAASHTVNLHGIQMMSVERSDLDRLALQAYLEAGGTVLDEFRVRDIDFELNRLIGVLDGIEEVEIRYETLIAADGALSTVRRKLTGEPPHSILSLEALAPHNGSPLVMHYEDGFFGYSWYAPAGDIAKIGCCAYAGTPNLHAHLDSFAEYMNVEYDHLRGAYIPTGEDVLLSYKGVYFLGDAASLICPPSGEGIYYALLSAKMLSIALVEGISYKTLMRRHVHTIDRQYKTRDLFFNTEFIIRGIELADMTPYGAERAVKFALRHFTGFY